MSGLPARADHVGAGGVRVPGAGQEAVHRLKFSGWRGVGDALAGAVAALGPPPADAVTWVPLAPRRAERGFDQAKVLARALARRLDLPAVAVVRRTTATAPAGPAITGGATAGDGGAFSRIPHVTAPARLLLVDDVLTTGATASACAAALVDAGATEIHLVTACRSFADRPTDRSFARREGPEYTRAVLPSGSVVARDQPR